MSVLYLIGLIQSLFVSSLILTKKRKRLSDLVLAFYILVMGFFLGFMYAIESGFYMQNPLIIILDILYWVWIGPALYIYIDLITSNENKFKPVQLLHLIPTVIVLAGFSGFFFDDSIEYFEQYKSNSLLFKIATYVWYYNSPVYCILCIIKLYKHKSRVKSYYSYTKNVDLKWLYYLANGFAAFLIVGLLSGLLKTYFNIELPFGIMNYTWLVMVLYIFGMGYFGYFQREVFSPSERGIRKPNVLGIPRTLKVKNFQYIKSGLDGVESREILNRLSAIMEKEKPYINCEINLRELAEIVQTTPHKLSQVINEQMKFNFFEFVNNYRVEEVKRALSNPSNNRLKIMAIAYDCGFSSKSAFYTIFKKKTSMTPTAYRENLLVDQIAS